MKIQYDQWKAEAIKRYGDDSSKWKFRCPACGVVTSVQEWKEFGSSGGTF